MAKKPALSPEEARAEALGTALATIERKYGKGAVMKLSDEAHVNIPVIPTGSIGLDLALGVGGIPRGRITEIFGPESSGKTTLTLHIIAECQKMGGTCAFVDAEHALDVNYARRLGVNTDELLISQPDYGEQALDIADMLVRSGAVDLVVVDSVAALIPQAELEGDMGESQVGGHARLMSHAMRRLTGTIHKSRTSVIFINQIRMKIGVTGYGSPETTTGGNALKFYSSVRMDIRRIQTLKDKEESFGSRTRVKVVKNPAVPQRHLRHPLRSGHLPLGRAHRPGPGSQDHRAERLVVRFRLRKAGPGPRKGPCPAGRGPGTAPPDRSQGHGIPGHASAGVHPQRRGSGRRQRRHVRSGLVFCVQRGPAGPPVFLSPFRAATWSPYAHRQRDSSPLSGILRPQRA